MPPRSTPRQPPRHAAYASGAMVSKSLLQEPIQAFYVPWKVKVKNGCEQLKQVRLVADLCRVYYALDAMSLPYNICVIEDVVSLVLNDSANEEGRSEAGGWRRAGVPVR